MAIRMTGKTDWQQQMAVDIKHLSHSLTECGHCAYLLLPTAPRIAHRQVALATQHPDHRNHKTPPKKHTRTRPSQSTLWGEINPSHPQPLPPRHQKRSLDCPLRIFRGYIPQKIPLLNKQTIYAFDCIYPSAVCSQRTVGAVSEWQ